MLELVVVGHLVQDMTQKLAEEHVAVYTCCILDSYERKLNYLVQECPHYPVFVVEGCFAKVQVNIADNRPEQAILNDKCCLEINIEVLNVERYLATLSEERLELKIRLDLPVF